MSQVHYKSSFTAAAGFTLCFLLFPVFLAAQESQFNYATGKVTGRNNIGGLAGRINEGVTVSNSFARGSITGETHVGGLVGTSQGAIGDCFSTGRVTGNSQTGGLVGSGTGAVTGSYWDMESSGVATSAGGTGRYSDPMTYPYAGDTYSGWDFLFSWKPDMAPLQNGGYPLLSASKVFGVEIQVYPPGSGTVSGDGYFIAGRQTSLQATPQPQMVFKGWFINGVMASNLQQYTMMVSGHTSLVARFESKTTDVRNQLSGTKSRLSIYPNPVKELLYVDLTRLPDHVTSVSVISMTGQTIIRSGVDHAGYGVLPITVSGLKAGMYLVSVRHGSGVISERFVKQ